jgi:DNA polymerase III alpha subunit
MFQERNRLLKLCVNGLEKKGLKEERFKERLKLEIKELDAQADHEYVLKLYDKCKQHNLRFDRNENNLLYEYLIGIAPMPNMDAPPFVIQGESPDIDVDYIKDVRDNLKRVWAPNYWGQDKVCEIGTYGTSGIKSAILDMTRVHNVDKSEIQAITVKMEDKDDEGKPLEWDKALEIYPEFKAFCEKNPRVSEAAKLLLDRNRSGGVHAGGLIISSVPIDGFVPLEVRSVNKQNPKGVICSAWTEGLNAQDLQPVGLIKFDLLVIGNLMQVALACKLVKERHGLKSICALEGGWDWSDISYLNDPKALAMANQGDLKCIFQFDSEGIRKLVKRGGVTSFDDLAAYSAIYRPGPLNLGMDARYCKRKKWSLNPNDEDGEPFNIHPLIKPFMEKTYNVLVYQEQIMDLLRVVGNIPDMHTEKVRKAISKKKIEAFLKYKEMFIENGQKNLGVNRDFVEDLWKQIEAFAEYGFNKSHAVAYTYISSRLLWLKAHYPIEFYTAILMCESDSEKFKQYRIDAKKHGVDICPVHINKSKENFHIEDGKIYFGFSNIKGIGEEVAKKIVAGQPYKDFPDFIESFGTDATVLKALISLGVFEEKCDRLTLRKFAEACKDKITKRRQRQQRHEAALTKKNDELRELLLTEIGEDDLQFKAMCEFTSAAAQLWDDRFSTVMRQIPYKYKGESRFREVSFAKQLNDLMNKRHTMIDNFEGKDSIDEEPMRLGQISLQNIEIEPKEVPVLTSQRTLKDERSYPEAEKLYYGFEWVHELETCPEYTGHTLDRFLEEAEMQKLDCWMVEVRIEAVRKRTSKKDVVFYSVDIEDANGKQMVVNVWQDDYTRWKDEIKKGNMLQMRVRPPSGGFNTLTFESCPRQEKARKWPNKESDYRIVLLKPAELPPPEPEVLPEPEYTFDADAIEGLDNLDDLLN